MLIWMIGIVGMSALLCPAAWLGEKAARLVRAPTRWIWALAILGSLLLPAGTRLLSTEWLNLSALNPAQSAAAIGNTSGLDLLQWSQSLGGGPAPNAWHQYDAYLKYAWIAMSVGLSVAFILSHAAWLRRRRSWTKGNLRQSPVYFAPDFGPAVMGCIRPVIIVPTWLKLSPPAQQAFVLAHENAHIEAGDPQMLTVALGICVLMPWNVPLWWNLKRLRKAVEVDCDARVLKMGHDAARYGEALLAVGLKQSRVIGTAIAMSESASFLEERIAIMINKPAKASRLIACGFAGLAVGLAAAAAQVAPSSIPHVSHPPASAGPSVLVKLTPSALDAFAGFYKGADNSVMTVTRENDHLNVQSSGESQADAVYPEGATRFFYANMNRDAKIEFEMDVQGQSTAAVLLQNGGRVSMPRIDAASAQRIETMRSAKLQSQSPSAGSEAALRHFIDGILSGRPALDTLSPPLAGQVAKDLPRLQLTLAPLGDLKSLEFRSVDTNGFDVYEATHVHGTSEWRVDVDAQGVITGAMFPLVVVGE
jgi:bla regulator protein blaR1